MVSPRSIAISNPASSRERTSLNASPRLRFALRRRQSIQTDAPQRHNANATIVSCYLKEYACGIVIISAEAA